MAEKLNFEKCFKVNCTPPLEVYETHINYFGSNIEASEYNRYLKQLERKADMFRQAKAVWEKNFKKSKTKKNE